MEKNYALRGFKKGETRMNYGAMIESRKSVRAFQPEALPEKVLAQVRDYYDNECHRLVESIKTQLLILDSSVKEALEGAAGYEKFMIGAPSYLVLLSDNGQYAEENAGFMMEDILLKLTEMGLDSCWITFTDPDQVAKALGQESNSLKPAAIAAFGKGVRKFRKMRVNIRSMSSIDLKEEKQFYAPKISVGEMVHHKTWNSKEEMFEKLDFYDDALWRAFYAASLSPSYLNRQPYGFVLTHPKAILVRCPDEYTGELDAKLGLGIVMLHFAGVLSVWGDKGWQMGPVEEDLDLPEGYTAVASCPVF